MINKKILHAVFFLIILSLSLSLTLSLPLNVSLFLFPFHFVYLSTIMPFAVLISSSQACAPLFHWNVLNSFNESQNTPVGNCFLKDVTTGQVSVYSPCREIYVEFHYKSTRYGTLPLTVI